MGTGLILLGLFQRAQACRLDQIVRPIPPSGQRNAVAPQAGVVGRNPLTNFFFPIGVNNFGSGALLGVGHRPWEDPQ